VVPFLPSLFPIERMHSFQRIDMLQIELPVFRNAAAAV
jgi:hypothetical protein